MNTKDIITLNYHNEFTRRALPVLENGSAVAICGEEGAGVTSLCRHIAGAWKSRGERKLMTFTAFGESDQLKLSQHLASQILGDSMPADWRLHCMSHLLNLMAVQIRDAKVGLIFLDRADSAPRGFIDAIMTVANSCGDAGWNVGVLLGMRRNTMQLPLFEDNKQMSSTSVALRCQIQPLDSGSILSVLDAMTPHFNDFSRRVDENEELAVKGLAHLAKVSNGNFRRLSQFAAFLNTGTEDLPVVPALVQKVWNEAFGLESLAFAA